jgi:hypothetical protein
MPAELYYFEAKNTKKNLTHLEPDQILSLVGSVKFVTPNRQRPTYLEDEIGGCEKSATNSKVFIQMDRR